MNIGYVSVRTEGRNELLIAFLKEQYNLTLKVVSSSVIYVELTGNCSWAEEILHINDKGFKVLEISNLAGMDIPIDHDFELIDRFEINDTDTININTKNRDIFDINKVSNIFLDTMTVIKAQLRENDPFVFITRKEYLINFTFFSLAVLVVFAMLDFTS